MNLIQFRTSGRRGRANNYSHLKYSTSIMMILYSVSVKDKLLSQFSGTLLFHRKKAELSNTRTLDERLRLL